VFTILWKKVIRLLAKTLLTFTRRTRMISIKSIIIAVIAIVLSLGFLIFVTQYYDPDNWWALGLYVGVMTAVFGGWILLVGRSSYKENPLKTMDFAMIAMFAALIRVVDFGSMYVPGLTVLYNVAPQIAGPILYYLPLGIVLAAALKLVPKPGAAFTLLFVDGIISLIFYGDPIWLTRGLVSALGLEAYYISSNRGTLSSIVLMGLMYGIMHGASASIYMTYSWSYWRPLFDTLPSAILSGVFMCATTFLGYALGERAKTVMY
jgi:hypothetical protein